MPLAKPDKGWLPRLWHSIALRLTFNYCILALVTSLIPLGVFYKETLALLESQFSVHVDNAAERLEAHFAQNGIDGLREEISLELGDTVNGETEMFLLLDARGEPVIGNMDPSPDFTALDEQGRRVDVLLRGRPVTGLLVKRHLNGAGTLIVGHDVKDLYTLTDIVTRVSMAAIATILVAILLGAYFFRLSLRRRIDEMRLVASQVGVGQLGRRIPIDEDGHDEFSQLGRDINTMLDQIEALMNGVRNVSDSIAHHLRTPLNRMLAKLHIAATEAGSVEELQAYLGALTKDIDVLAKISEKLLQIAEFESGTRRSNFQMARLDVIARDVVELYEAIADEQGTRLSLHAPDAVTVPGDRDLLAGAIMNLVENALKYGGEGGEIRVEIDHADTHATLRVSDCGPGIPEGKQKRIGERFYRLHSDQQGYGLGIATVVAICKLHGGDFSLRNGHPGLVASIRVPLRADRLSRDPNLSKP
ncbi:sensor histidine kinase [Bordetella genomosp. 13]|uniref:sensor histidine kinase n=1 Tax=Bordetella genomosp. 13 TaxID=463040 RepID=UPI0011A4E69C|nr:HAMP domain-containing sensor histidine kinase [Bordetella genomosp. 13]